MRMRCYKESISRKLLASSALQWRNIVFSMTPCQVLNYSSFLQASKSSSSFSTYSHRCWLWLATYLWCISSYFEGCEVSPTCSSAILPLQMWSLECLQFLFSFRYPRTAFCLDPLKILLQAIILQRWTLPQFMCKFCPFISNLSVNVSVLTLVLISIDRYKGITKPLSHRPRKRHTYIKIILIWFFSTICAIPQAVFYTFDYIDEETPFCHVKGEETSVKMKVFHAYNIFLVLVEYIIPLFVMSITYSCISSRLWKSVTPGEGSRLQSKIILKNKQKVIQMLMTVVIIFSLCWLPYQVYFITLLCNPLINNFKFINLIFLISHWLAMSNSCYNPFIYTICSPQFRQEVTGIIGCVKHKEEDINTTALLREQMSVLWAH